MLVKRLKHFYLSKRFLDIHQHPDGCNLTKEIMMNFNLSVLRLNYQLQCVYGKSTPNLWKDEKCMQEDEDNSVQCKEYMTALMNCSNHSK